MAIAVPGERRDPVAELDPVAFEPLGDLERALTDGAIVGVVHRPFDRPRRDLVASGNWTAAKSMTLCMSRGQSCIRPSMRFPPDSAYRRLIAARGLFMGLAHWRRVGAALQSRGTCAAFLAARAPIRRKEPDARPAERRPLRPGLVSPDPARGAHAGRGRRAPARDRRFDPAMRRADHADRAGGRQPAGTGDSGFTSPRATSRA